MDVSILQRIEADPNYQKLVSERKSFGWTLAIVIPMRKIRGGDRSLTTPVFAPQS